MRTWYVPPSILDPQRLLGQHREIHALLGSITSPRGGYQNHPVTKLYNGPHLTCLVNFHRVILVEFANRGWGGHQTPVTNEVIELARSYTTHETCGSWRIHIARHVDHLDLPPRLGFNHADHSMHGDMHDLIARWVEEGKGLIGENAYIWTRWHRDACTSSACRVDAKYLMRKYDAKRRLQAEDD